MPSLRARKTSSLVTKAVELAVAVPQVVAHRVTRMAMADPKLSARDRREFELMVAEKKAAFSEAWSAMALQTVRANQSLAASLFVSFWSPSQQRKLSASGLTAQLQHAALDVLGKGVAPIHRTAVANAKRLARTKLR